MPILAHAMSAALLLTGAPAQAAPGEVNVVHLTLHNDSGCRLTGGASYVLSGEWTTQPPATIEAGQTVTWGTTAAEVGGFTDGTVMRYTEACDDPSRNNKLVQVNWDWWTGWDAFGEGYGDGAFNIATTLPEDDRTPAPIGYTVRPL